MLLQIQGCAVYCLGCFVEHTSLLSPPIGRQGCVLKFELCEKGVWFSLRIMLLFGNTGLLIGQNSTLQGPPFFERTFYNRQHAHPCVLQVHCAGIHSFYNVFVQLLCAYLWH